MYHKFKPLFCQKKHLGYDGLVSVPVSILALAFRMSVCRSRCLHHDGAPLKEPSLGPKLAMGTEV